MKRDHAEAAKHRQQQRVITATPKPKHPAISWDTGAITTSSGTRINLLGSYTIEESPDDPDPPFAILKFNDNWIEYIRSIYQHDLATGAIVPIE